MVRKGRYLYVCPACKVTTWTLRVGSVQGKFLETYSLVDGRSYPSCDMREQLCYWCELDGEGEKDDLCMAMPVKPAAKGDSTSSTSSVLAAGLLTQYCELWDFLTGQTYADGSRRPGGKLALSCESGALGLCLTDTGTGQYAFLNGNSVDDLLLEAEVRLKEGKVPWRASRYQGKGKR